MLRTFSDNPTCRHIVFGGCHDAGYLLNLEQFKHNEAKAARITLLETTPMFRGFAELSHFKRARFDSVFKSEPLPEATPSAFVATTSSFVPSSAQAPVQPTALFRATTNPSPRTSVSSPSPHTPPSSVTGPETPGTISSNGTNGDASWGKCNIGISFPETVTIPCWKSCVPQHVSARWLTEIRV